MPKFDTQAEQDAYRTFEGLGFSPSKVKRGSTKTPDFEIDGDDPAYLVEVKSRFWPDRILSPGSDANSVHLDMYDDEVARNWLWKARDQFAPVDSRHERLWFIWASMESVSHENQFERVMRTLYGIRDAYDTLNLDRQVRIFYSKPPAFEAAPEIDGAILISPPDGVAFCPNEFSPRLPSVLASKLVGALRAIGLRHVLPAEYASESTYVAPLNIDRHDERAILRHCQTALGLPYLQFWASDVEFIQTGAVSLKRRSARRPTHDEIASRAYELFVTRGRQHGHDLDDWLQSERELSHPRKEMAE